VARTHRGPRLADQSQTARGTRAKEGEASREGSAPPHDPSTPPSRAPCTRSQEQSCPNRSRAWRPRARRRSSEHGGSGNSPPRHPANCRTTRTQTTTTGTPRRTYRLSPARRHHQQRRVLKGHRHLTDGEVVRVGLRPPVVQKRAEEGEVVLEARHAILPQNRVALAVPLD
jgi:hypothetical protein